MKRIFKLIAILFVGFLLFLTGQTVSEHIKIRQDIREFTKKAVLQTEISTDTIKYYKVSRETYYPNELYREPFYNGDLTQPGSAGDIFVTQQAPYPNWPGIYDIVTFYFGGHAAYVGEDNIIYDIAGYPEADESFLKVLFKGGRSTHVSDGYNYWLDANFYRPDEPHYRYFGSYYRSEYFGLRVKDVTNEDIDQVSAYMKHLADVKAQYNFLYILNNKNKYYCTDMMSRGYGSITNSDGKPKYNLNNDGVAVTINDLILSKHTYISFYVRTDRDGTKHIYYID